MIFSRDDLPCDELKSHVLSSDVECTFLEIRIRQSKWLIVGGYNPLKKNISYFLTHVGRELDKYLFKYENLLLLGDWNSTVSPMVERLNLAKNTIKPRLLPGIP